MDGRARMYDLGFLVFTISSVLLAVTWTSGDAAALWLIAWRIVQGVGGLSVPFGVVGTVWAYLKLHDTSQRRQARLDWGGNVTSAVGLVAVMVAITDGLQPYGGHPMGWSNPWVLGALVGGLAVLGLFVWIEPLFDLSLFRIRVYSLGNLANLMVSLGRGGLQFVLVLWLQGIWLPQHGYSFEETPLWAGIHMLPMTVGFLGAAAGRPVRPAGRRVPHHRRDGPDRPDVLPCSRDCR